MAQQARKENKAKIVVIDVHRNQTGKFADWFIPIRPGTDSALALGIMHILFAENMTDEEFIEQYTEGNQELKEHVKQYDPKTVSEITGVSVEDIYKLARLYGSVSPSYIRIGNGLQHHDNGGMNVRTISCLPALTGQWLKKGGGAIKGNSDYLAHNAKALQRPDLLENKNTRRINMNRIGEALNSLEPPIRSLYVYSSNPAVVAPNGNLVRKGLEREDLFMVVHDLFITETAKYADIVLPASSSFESTDFYASYWHHYVQIQHPVIAPLGESKSNVDVFKLLAKAMGFEEAVFQESEAEMIRAALDYPNNPNLKGINYEALIQKQYIKADVKPLFPGRLKTPSGKIELYSRRMERHGYPPLPTYIPLVNEGEEDFLFVSAPNHHFLNSTLANNQKHQLLEKEPILHMNSHDAAVKGIKDGSVVRIWNHQGECSLKVSIGENVLPGVVVTQGLWEGTDTHNRLMNTLTPDRIADMGGGAVFFSGRVNVSK